jgi:hypothetical protein
MNGCRHHSGLESERDLPDDKTAVFKFNTATARAGNIQPNEAFSPHAKQPSGGYYSIDVLSSTCSDNREDRPPGSTASPTFSVQTF